MLDWALQLTFFLACFVLTERRIEAIACGLLLLLSKKSSARLPRPGAAESAGPRKPIGLMSANKDSYLQQLLNRFMLPAIFHPVGKAFAILLVIAIAVVGAVGIGKVEGRSPTWRPGT